MNQQPVIPMPFIPPPKVDGQGTVYKKDGTVSQPEPAHIALLRKVVSSVDEYWEKDLIDEINDFLKEYDNGCNSYDCRT